MWKLDFLVDILLIFFFTIPSVGTNLMLSWFPSLFLQQEIRIDREKNVCAKERGREIRMPESYIYIWRDKERDHNHAILYTESKILHSDFQSILLWFQKPRGICGWAVTFLNMWSVPFLLTSILETKAFLFYWGEFVKFGCTGLCWINDSIWHIWKAQVLIT